MTEQEQTVNHNVIMKELSNIQVALGINTAETSNIKSSVGKIESDIKETRNAVQFQNGRVRTLEDWGEEARRVIENTTKIANETATKYGSDKIKIWTAMSVLLFLGATIIGLSIMAINSKIKDGINEALSAYNIEIKK